MEDVAKIEHMTRGHTRNQRWHEQRALRLCSSKFGTICKYRESTDKDKLARSLVFPKKFISHSVKHGRDNEHIEIAQYEKITGNKVHSNGLFLSRTHPYIASSPDGLIDVEKILEVKFPYSSRMQAIAPKTVPYFEEINGFLSLKRDHNYFYQIQGQLFTTDKILCHFVVNLKVIEVHRDDNFITG